MFTGYDIEFEEGVFWTYRWEYETRSCAQRSGCSTRGDEGEFQVTLGAPSMIGDARVHELLVTGDSAVSLQNTTRDFAPRWRYLGIDDGRMVVSMGGGLNTLFDPLSGFWAGGGFFTDRFSSDELIKARSASIGDDFDFAVWPGFRTGTAQVIGRAAGQSQCEQIDGIRVCPREEAFSASESEYYRAGVGPLAYSFDFSTSFSGGGFFSSSTTKERLALIAASLRGDSPDPASPDPSPTVVQTGQLFEAEPNDTALQAQALPLSQPISGDAALGDAALGPSIEAQVGREAWLVGAEDHYVFELRERSVVEVTLLLDADIRDGVVFGLLLWDSRTSEPITAVFSPGRTDVVLSATLPAGQYLVGVAAFGTPRGRVDYVLQVSAGLSS